MAEIRSRERRRNSLKPTFVGAVLPEVQVRRACPAGFCGAAARRQPADMIVGLVRALSRAARATQPCPPLLTCPRTALSPPSLTMAGEKGRRPRLRPLEAGPSTTAQSLATRRSRRSATAAGSRGSGGEHACSRRIGREGRRSGFVRLTCRATVPRAALLSP